MENTNDKIKIQINNIKSKLLSLKAYFEPNSSEFFAINKIISDNIYSDSALETFQQLENSPKASDAIKAYIQEIHLEATKLNENLIKKIVDLNYTNYDTKIAENKKVEEQKAVEIPKDISIMDLYDNSKLQSPEIIDRYVMELDSKEEDIESIAKQINVNNSNDVVKDYKSEMIEQKSTDNGQALNSSQNVMKIENNPNISNADVALSNNSIEIEDYNQYNMDQSADERNISKLYKKNKANYQAAKTLPNAILFMILTVLILISIILTIYIFTL